MGLRGYAVASWSTHVTSVATTQLINVITNEGYSVYKDTMWAAQELWLAKLGWLCFL